MDTQFSKNLIQETIKVFYEEDGLELTPEMAQEYLHRLAGLYLAFARGGGNRTTEGAVPPPLT